jgi:hypothetical protein
MTNYINCFADAEKRYNDTKPLVSKNHMLEQDVRPIGDRARKYERIIKVSDTCYALSCGGRADPVFAWGSGDTKMRETYPITLEEIARLSPIVWRKLKDGTETITIRNGAGEYQHNRIYSFINRALPRNMWFAHDREGKQFVSASGGPKAYLPKNTSAPRYLVEYSKGEKKKGNMSSWATRYMKSATAGYDGLSVVFKREENGEFTLVGERHKVMVDRTRVNKDVKSAHKDGIKELFTAAMTFYPMMKSQLNWELKRATQAEMDRIAKEHKIETLIVPRYYDLFAGAEPKLMHAIVKDSAHPLRHSLNIAAMFVIDGALDSFSACKYPDLDKEGKDKQRSKMVRAAFTRWINKIGGFTTTTNEEK